MGCMLAFCVTSWLNFFFQTIVFLRLQRQNPSAASTVPSSEPLSRMTFGSFNFWLSLQIKFCFCFAWVLPPPPEQDLWQTKTHTKGLKPHLQSCTGTPCADEEQVQGNNAFFRAASFPSFSVIDPLYPPLGGSNAHTRSPGAQAFAPLPFGVACSHRNGTLFFCVCVPIANCPATGVIRSNSVHACGSS